MAIQRESFVGFTFNNIHSSKFKVYSVTNGGRYNMPLFADISDVTSKVAGQTGSYFWGTEINHKTLTLNCYVDGIAENQLRNLQAWLNPATGIKQLILDEARYKVYSCKVANTPEFNFIPHSDGVGGHLYYGEFELQFVAYNPYAYSIADSLDSVTYDNLIHFYDSGIMYSGFTPPSTLTSITTNKDFCLYNAGNAPSRPIISITGTWEGVTIKNKTTNQEFTLYGNDISQTFTIDCRTGQVKLGILNANSIHSGSFIQLEGSSGVDSYPNVTFTNGSKTVTLATGEEFWDDVVGKYLCIGDNKWYKVVSKDSATQVTLDKNFEGSTDVYNPVTCFSLNELSITGTSLNISELKFEYKYCYL